MAIIKTMDVSIADAKNRLPELIRAVEDGEKVVITRHGKPVAQIAPPPSERRQVRLGRHEGPHPAHAGMGRPGRSRPFP